MRVNEMNVMQILRSFVVAVVASVVLATPTVVLADGRVALVVGNSTYAHIGRLPNPGNDARDMSAALRRFGFEVTTALDLDAVARVEHQRDVRPGALPRERAQRLGQLHAIQRTTATRTVSGGSFADLNEDLLGDETLVAYAAAAGTTAADGQGRNSPYTAALLSHLETPLEVGLLFRRVRAAVLASTNGAQRPHEYHSLVGEHYLTRRLTTGTSVTASAAPANPAPADPPLTELHIVVLRERAEAGDTAAQHEMAERYANGRGVRPRLRRRDVVVCEGGRAGTRAGAVWRPAGTATAPVVDST